MQSCELPNDIPGGQCREGNCVNLCDQQENPHDTVCQSCEQNTGEITANEGMECSAIQNDGTMIPGKCTAAGHCGKKIIKSPT